MFPLHNDQAESITSPDPGPGTKDGVGAGDHDRPYTPRTPTALSPFPFTTRQYMRLLLLRSRLRSGLTAELGHAFGAS